MNIVDEIGHPALLEQTAEECIELSDASNKLGHTCLKLARKLRGENPTPAQMDDLLSNICEEAADIEVCINMLIRSGVIIPDEFNPIIRNKTERWEKRIEEMKNKEKGE